MLPGDDSGYGRELFSTFVPSSARGRMMESVARGGRPVALLSGALVARHAGALRGPVLEVGWPRFPADVDGTMARALLTGVLRAVRYADAIVAVSVPPEVRAASPAAPRAVVSTVLEAAELARFDRPVVMVARAAPLPPGAAVERLSDGLYRDLEAGFTAMAFAPAALGSGGASDLDALVRLTAPLAEQDLGLELELDGGASNVALLLARIEDAGLALSAVRGAFAEDELAGALLVVDPATVPELPAGTPCRIVLDERLGRAVARAAATGDGERVEAAAWLEMEALVGDVGAAGTATRLLDVLAQGLRR